MLWGDSYRGQPYGQAARAVDTVLDFVDDEGRRMITGGTAAQLFRFYPTPQPSTVAAHGTA